MKKMMTNIKTLAALLMAVAGTTACSSEDDIAVDTLPQKPAEQTYTMTVEASKGSDATTRALSLDGTTLNATWAEGDVVEIWSSDGSTVNYGELTAQSAGQTTTLTGTLTGIMPTVNTSLLLKYRSNDYSSQTGTLDYIAQNCDYATARVKVTSVSGSEITTTAASFENQQAIVKFTLKDSDGTAISAWKLTVSDGTNTYTVTPASDTSELFVAIPGISSQALTLTANIGSATYTYEKSDVTFTNGQYYAVTVKMKKQATDLSMVDNAGNARSTMSTANCYMVHTAGDYKLPLVYGNAIKDGAANTDAYTGIENANTTLTFPNHAGNAIDAPWITKATTGEGVAKGMGITVASAELLWQDAQGLITKVGISGDYLTLTVGKDATTQQGNALVAVKDGSGNIVWSWHIWVTTETFATLTTVATGSHDYEVTPVNLGWVPTGGEGKQGYAPYYQWGRKDAFIPGTWNDNTNRTVYNISNTAVTGLNYTESTTATIADNIKNPTTYYYNSSNKGPCNTTYYNMWDAQQTGTGNIATATKKTVYDPCPAGFCVPTGNLYYFMGNGNNRTMSTWDGTNKGATWKTSITGNALFFPASGYRSGSSGTLYGVGSLGYCWSASPTSSGSGHLLAFTSSSWSWRSYGRADGFPVRAVKE